MRPQISPLTNVNGVSSPTQSLIPVAGVLTGRRRKVVGGLAGRGSLGVPPVGGRTTWVTGGAACAPEHTGPARPRWRGAHGARQNVHPRFYAPGGRTIRVAVT